MLFLHKISKKVLIKGLEKEIADQGKDQGRYSKHRDRRVARIRVVYQPLMRQ